MQRNTRQRDAITTGLTRAGRPLTPGEIHPRSQRDVPTLGLATVYRTLKALVTGGEIVPVELPGESPRYESVEAAARHHHHFHCRTCDGVFDVQGCADGLDGLVPPGFQLDNHEIVLYGICADCSGNRS